MKHDRRDENGMVAIIVATMIMIIMSLVVLGFARIMQREQRQALDKSLSTQAFYAAESGINDAVQKLHDPTQTVPNKTACDTSVGNSSGLDGTVDANLNAGYSCLLINNTPKTLEYNGKSIKTTDSQTVPIKGAADERIYSTEISWDDGATGDAYQGCPSSNVTLPAISNWTNSPGILRLDLVLADGVLTRDNLITKEMTTYLYPSGSCGASSFAYNSFIGPNAGKIVTIHCTDATTPHHCKATIDLSNITTAFFYLRMRSIYNSSNVTVKIFDSSGTQLPIKGAQVQVDSTGKVSDVVRRIQVRVPVQATYNVPKDPLETTLTICKQFTVVPDVSFTPSATCTGY